jgi:hypothetical protein
MRMVQVVAAVAGLAVVAVPVVAQVGEPVRERPALEARGMRAGAPMAMARNPAAGVLAQREALGLTADQVRQLEAIKERVERENAPRIERLRAVHGEREAMERSRIRQMSAAERQQLHDHMAQVRPIMEEVRQTNHAAGDEIRALLTEEQHAQFRELRRAERRDGAWRGPRGGERQGAWQQRRGERSERGDVRYRRGPRGGGQ